MTDSSLGWVISFGFLAVVISLTVLSFDLQQQTQAINEQNPQWVASASSSSVSSSISASIASAKQAAYCTSISEQADQRNASAAIIEIASPCPGGVMSWTPLLIMGTLIVSGIVFFVDRIRGY